MRRWVLSPVMERMLTVMKTIRIYGYVYQCVWICAFFCFLLGQKIMFVCFIVKLWCNVCAADSTIV